MQKTTLKLQVGKRLRSLALAFICSVMVAGLLQSRADAKPLVVSGQIEGYEVHISVPAPLRITAVNAHEGDAVTQGQSLLELDGSDVQAKRSGAKMMLAALEKERQQLDSDIAQLKKRLPGNGSEGLAVSGKLRRSGIHSNHATSSGSSSSADPPASAKQMPNALLSAQASSLDDEYALQKKELTDGYDKQMKMLDSTIRANQEAADKTFEARRAALQEVGKAKLEAANKHSLFSFLIPSKLRGAKAQAITEVIKAKEEALTQGYEQAKKGLQQVAEAQRNAGQEAFAAKQQALTEGYTTKRKAIEQLATSMSALQDAAAQQQNMMKQQLSSFQSSLSGLKSPPSGGMGGMLAASQAGVMQLQLESARTRLLAVNSEIAKVKAGQLEVDAKSKMLKVTSPISGRCATSSVHVGELPIPGQTIMTIVDPDRMYLRAYIPEGLIGGIKIGQHARVHLDYKQASAIDATVTSIDEQASFTPENVSLPQDRVRQVFGVKLLLKDKSAYAKPGMPGDATFDLD